MATRPNIQVFPLTGWEYYDPAYLESKNKLCPKMSFTDDYNDPRGDVLHHAIDLFASPGTPVLAVVDGVMWPNKELGDTDKEFIYYERGGWHCYILGDDGYIYYYAHILNPPLFKPWARVRAGVIIGQNGSSGVVYSCPHTHFATYKTSSTGAKLGPINPYSYIKQAPVLDVSESQKLTVSRLGRLGYTLVSRRVQNGVTGPIFAAKKRTHTGLWIGGTIVLGGIGAYLAWKYL